LLRQSYSFSLVRLAVRMTCLYRTADCCTASFVYFGR
jgi:hypothetical protein